MNYSFIQNAEHFIFDTESYRIKNNETVDCCAKPKPCRYNEYCKIKFMSLHIVHECPLYCQYCYGDGGVYNTPECSRMSSTTMKNAIDYLFTYCTDDEMVHVNFFGGEPLLGFDLIKECVGYCESKAQEHGKKMEYSISTSALILSEEILAFIQKYNISMSVSIDANKAAHDRHRRFKNNAPSYDKVVEGFESIAAKSTKVLITATLTHHTLNEIDNYRDLLKIGANNFRFKTVTGMTSDLKLTNEDYDKLAEKYEILAKEYLEDIRNGIIYDFGDFTKWIQRLFKGKVSHFNCSATEDYINVDPTGEIYICHKFVGDKNGRLGNVNDLSNPVQNLKFNTGESKCKSCWACNLCGGGCYFDGYEATKNPYHTFATNKCKIHKAQIRGAIYIYYHLRVEGLLEKFMNEITSSTNSYQLTV